MVAELGSGIAEAREHVERLLLAVDALPVAGRRAEAHRLALCESLARAAEALGAAASYVEGLR